MRSLFRLLKETASRDSAKVAVWIGAGGVALMVGNLVLAGVLSAEDFGRLTLVEALLSVGVGIGPLGHDNLVVRKEIPQRWGSILRISSVSLLPAILLGGVAWFLYGLGLSGAALVTLGCWGGSIGLLCASFDRADVRLDRAQAVSQLPFLAFAAGALILWILGDQGWLSAGFAIVGGYALSGLVGLLTFGMRPGLQEPVASPAAEIGSWWERWRKAFTFLGIVSSGFILNQVERFIIPRALGLEELAVFGVAATLVLGPYKLLQGGIGYALMPRLTSAARSGERRSLIARELRFAVISSMAVGVAAVVLVPLAVQLLYGGKYPVGVGIVLAVALVGALRATYGAVAATAKALGNGTELRQYNATGWASIGVAVAGGFGFAWGGLVGVTLGVAGGWLVRTFVVGLIARGALAAQDRAPEGKRTTEESPA